MLNGINDVYTRINDIRKGAKNFTNSLKPEKVTEFENMYKNSISQKNEGKDTKEAFVHPFLKSKNKVKENLKNNLLDKNENNDKNLILQSVKKASNKYGVPEDLIKAVIKVESNFDKNSVSRVGAMGLMQLMPKTALELKVEKPFDIEENVDGGTKYLKMMIDKYDGDLDKVLSAYNAGPNRVDEVNGIPDIKETQNYVKTIRKILNK
ncbi:MAG TPA: lytic transglycosylase domain-containing protein [Spirochaetota bacterium]|nr:lytic transglycosylase domain-containing protein [Spirochaetota bacterium]